jgi:phosphoadenosine phosphosulfate reductase
MNALTFAQAAELSLTPEDRIRIAHAQHGDKLVVSTSFGAQSEILLHRVTRLIPDIPVIFVDTGYLFEETHDFRKDLTERLNLNLHIYHPLRPRDVQEAQDGKRWEQGDLARIAYNFENKIEPMDRAIKELGATGWLAGLRRAQHAERQNIPFDEITKGGIHKFYPHREMSDDDVVVYRKLHDLPEHPLIAWGYTSIGDTHSTVAGEQHAFCGLHEQKAAPRGLAGFDPVI